MNALNQVLTAYEELDRMAQAIALSPVMDVIEVRRLATTEAGIEELVAKVERLRHELTSGIRRAHNALSDAQSLIQREVSE